MGEIGLRTEIRKPGESSSVRPIFALSKHVAHIAELKSQGRWGHGATFYFGNVRVRLRVLT